MYFLAAWPNVFGDVSRRISLNVAYQVPWNAVNVTSSAVKSVPFSYVSIRKGPPVSQLKSRQVDPSWLFFYMRRLCAPYVFLGCFR